MFEFHTTISLKSKLLYLKQRQFIDPQAVTGSVKPCGKPVENFPKRYGAVVW